ncbi:MAG: multicopper oxidase domain-containing protein, partial [Candidatus Competibacterales bacterium]|nr:multicopper oxidase domain-containing protein [Candidatus Competibacterales bacterium]
MRGPMLSRRTLLGAWASGALLAALPGGRGLAASGRKAYRLQARKATVPLVGPGYPATGIWGYDGRAPGPELRVRQGEPLQVRVENTLDQPTSVHWHGIRLPNAMDGVAGLTQAPIRPGEGFTYAFTPPDAGTYWYHSHVDGAEQIGRGLAGALIVEEAEPSPVDRDLTWVVNDWRLDQQARIVDDFGGLHDLSHAGRIGNVVTVNGRLIDEFPVRAGERIRLRLINAATARHLALEFRGHRPWILALDGQPVTPYAPDDATVVLAPGARVDLLLVLDGRPG